MTIASRNFMNDSPTLTSIAVG